MALSNPQILSVYATAEKAIRRTCAQFNVRPSDDVIADLQQGTLERLLAKYDASRGTPDQLAWRIAANEAVSFLRGRGKGTATDSSGDSLTVEDEDGNATTADLADDSANPFDLIAARQLDAEITRGIAELSAPLAAGVKASLDDDAALTSTERVYALRAREALAESLRASHFPIVRAAKAKRAKVAKRQPKVETEEAPTPALTTLRTLSTWHYVCQQLLAAQLTVA